MVKWQGRQGEDGKERYIKGAVLGEGTFGVVTKAEDTLTQKVVAIKKIELGNYRRTSTSRRSARSSC